ncbi:hypothetical protein ElyMa_003982400 [Elysia marginata]|uniref:Uncharacterized protein n=1 Tax=Elysia marginata TaxID=1093978 RepID=A0AAV4FYI7_9GAST|nr:hypothetical protein ElyMa_003982400 [Elysia marginata]
MLVCNNISRLFDQDAIDAVIGRRTTVPPDYQPPRQANNRSSRLPASQTGRQPTSQTANHREHDTAWSVVPNQAEPEMSSAFTQACAINTVRQVSRRCMMVHTDGVSHRISNGLGKS